MSLKPRQYQSEFVDGLREAMRRRVYTDEDGRERYALPYKRICGYLPQGSGKSIIAAIMASGAAGKRNSVLVLTHRDEILKQNFSKMDALGLRPFILNANTVGIPDALIVVAMTQTVASRCREKDGKSYEDWRKWLRGFKLVMVDEAHRGEHDDVLSLLDKDTSIIGLSASICRYGNSVRQLGTFYDCIVKGITTPELVEMGYLVRSKNFAYEAPKLADIPISPSTGDYVQRRLQSCFKKKERYTGIIDNWLKICPDTKTLVFTTGATHAIDLCRAFNDVGIKAKYLLSEKFPETDDIYSGDRETILREYKDGVFKVLINVAILDTGFDDPSIRSVVLDFATTSYTKYAQAVGRGSRPYPGKTFFNVLDFGGNIARHGIYERPDPPMSLWHNKSKPGIVPTRECPLEKKGCGRLVPIVMDDCPYCGYHFPTNKEIYEVELREIISDNREDLMSPKEWIASKLLENQKNSNRWKVPEILTVFCIKNAGQEKRAFTQAINLIEEISGKKISPSYWKYFKQYILKDKARGNNSRAKT